MIVDQRPTELGPYEPGWLCHACSADFRHWMQLPGEDRRDLDAGAVPADVGPAPCRLILHLPPEAPAGDRLQGTQVDDLVREPPEGRS